VEPGTCPYIDTKPLHNSQIKLSADEQEIMRNQYGQFGTWTFYTFECIPDDYELPRLLMSYGSNMMVIKPIHLVNQIKENLHKLSNNYASLCE
jgi:predicted DNA-binding transcriptional regulator YafY